MPYLKLSVGGLGTAQSAVGFSGVLNIKNPDRSQDLSRLDIFIYKGGQLVFR